MLAVARSSGRKRAESSRRRTGAAIGLLARATMGAGARLRGFWAAARGARPVRQASAVRTSVLGFMGAFRVRVGGGARAGVGRVRPVPGAAIDLAPAHGILRRLESSARPALDPSERYDKDVTRLLAQMRREGGDDAAARVFPMV